MVAYLTVFDVIAVHADVMRRMGLPPFPLRDSGGLESAIMRPRMAATYEGADIIRQAALLAIGISQAQAFLDGNKRTALAATRLFLRSNGLTFTGNTLDLAKQLEAVAERSDTLAKATDQFGNWLRENVA